MPLSQLDITQVRNAPTEILRPKPFIKWLGGKSQLLSAIAENMPSDYNDYYEPFVGSGAVFFGTISKERTSYINDINVRLVKTYITLRDRPSEVVRILEKLANDFNSTSSLEEKRNFYNSQKERFNSLNFSTVNHTVLGAALFIYLNKTCFNGVYRENSKGIFNVPFGDKKRPMLVDKENIFAVSEHLAHTKIFNGDYEESISAAQKGDFIYLDPPYHPLTKTSSFTKYHKENFVEDHQKKLRNIFDKLTKKGCYVMMSNSDSQFIEDLYSGYKIIRVKANRTINCKKESRGKISELLIKNY
jgi:DNA adenine methylase